MNRPTATQQGQDLLSGLRANNHTAFAKLYDQYAPVLLGIITKIVSDKAEAVALLETTFREVRSQINQYRPENQPLFTWLLNIARCLAIDALKKRQQLPATVFQLSTTGKVISLNLPKNDTALLTTGARPTDTHLKEQLDSILFENCAPEEAFASTGLPVETARKQLRAAMHQLRTSMAR